MYRLDSILTAMEIVRSDNLKVERTGLANGFVMGCERHRGSSEDPFVFDLSH